MKQYTTTITGRKNLLKSVILRLFRDLSSYPRLLLEVFIRKNFGERYFKLSSALTVTVILLILPSILYKEVPPQSSRYFDPGEGMTIVPMENEQASSFWFEYMLWYVFVVAFLAISVRHHLDKKRNPSPYRFERISRYTGDVSQRFRDFNFFGIKNDLRVIECWLEPGFFFIIGLVLSLIGQPVGVLILVSSVFYSLAYVAMYVDGDDVILNAIDQIILNQEIEKTFVDDEDPSKTRGVTQPGRKPQDKEIRRQILQQMTADNEVFEVR